MFLNTSVVILCKSSDQSLFEKKLHTSPKSTSQDFQTVSLVLSLLITWKVCVHMSRYLIVFILLPLFYFRQMLPDDFRLFVKTYIGQTFWQSNHLKGCYNIRKESTKTREDKLFILSWLKLYLENPSLSSISCREVLSFFSDSDRSELYDKI